MFRVLSDIIKWIGEHFKGMLFLLIVVVLLMPSSDTENPANLQEIKLSGVIMNSDVIIQQIEEAQNNKNIKGVLFNVNSGGGSVPPSIEISYAIKELKKHKPVVAYASGTMASGSYYASIYSTKIIANAGSIIGSIGVIMESANIQKLLDTIGIKPQIVKQGLYKEAGTPTREWTPEEREELEQLTLDTYNLFVSDVATARGLDINDSNRFANAHIFSAKKALEVGLIDAIGVKRDAKLELKKLSKIDKEIWKKKDKIDSIIEKFEGKVVTSLKSSFYGLKSELF
ncbi:protease IV (PspA) [hydrothermal vent metagenome]|uniref:Protease IV (PspA) n=1 Tax=hydrothermal vent metagenome TaxID=652676 RepID=A0A1W1BVP7_9ZZZZ